MVGVPAGPPFAPAPAPSPALPQPYGSAPQVPPPYVLVPPQPPLPPGLVWPYPPPLPPRSRPPIRDSVAGWVVVALCLVTMVVSGVVGVGVLAASLGGGAEATWYEAGEVEAPPGADASSLEWNRWARRAMEAAVAGQAAALLSGDEEGYVAAVDPDASGLRRDLERQFGVLRQMGVAQWAEEVRGRPEVTGEGAWHAEIQVSYCFGDPTCRTNTLVIETDWRLESDHLVLSGVAPSGREQFGPRPWEVSDLAVATGARTVVATSSGLEYRLAQTLDVAERAAAVADQFAAWNGPPSRYVIFVASGWDCNATPDADWCTWYGPKPDWSGGLYVDATDNELVVSAASGDMLFMLTHEMTHVATLAGRQSGWTPAAWWLIEGIAEYAAMLDRPVSSYDGIGAVRTFVDRRWDSEDCSSTSDPLVCPPTAVSALDDAAVRYGVAYLAVRHLAQAYGQDAMVDFFGRVVHEDETFDAASRGAFDAPWATVRAQTEAAVHDA